MARPSEPLLFDPAAFVGFGPSQFHPDGTLPGGKATRSKSPDRLRTAVRKQAPTTPGVYGMLDARGRVIYIGKAKNLRSRLLSYFRTNSRNPKAGRIIQHTRVLLWEFAADELASLLRELELIRRFRPRYNVLGQPGRQRYRYLCLGRSPANFVYVTREPTGKEPACYGPFVGRDRLKAVAKRLNDYYRLRDCASTVPMRFADDKTLFPTDESAKCLRHELNFCLGPCAGFTDRPTYSRATTAARRFLDGDDRSALDKLRADMRSAAAACEFERAAAVRDRLADFEWLDERLAVLRNSRDQTALVYPLAGPDGRTVWYLLNRGQVWAAVTEPTTPEARKRTADLLDVVSVSLPRVGRTCVDSVLLVAAWFRKRAGEKLRLRSAAEVTAELRAEVLVGSERQPRE